MFQGTTHSRPSSATLHRGPRFGRVVQFVSLIAAAALAATITFVLRSDGAPVADQPVAGATALSRGMTADTARWAARAEYETALAIRPAAALAADTARWIARADHELAAISAGRGITADTARWAARAEYETALSRGITADTARWAARAEY
jgi:hypothetical protein